MVYEVNWIIMGPWYMWYIGFVRGILEYFVVQGICSKTFIVHVVHWLITWFNVYVTHLIIAWFKVYVTHWIIAY